MPTIFPCATCGALLNDNTFEYQKHMTDHWSGKNNSLPLPSIFTTSSIPSPTLHPCFFCDFAFYDIHQIASHMVASHSSDLHSILCPTAGDDFLRESVSAFLNEFAVSGAGFVSLCDCFSDHPSHILISVDNSAGLGSPVSGMSIPTLSPITPKIADFLVSIGVSPNTSSRRVYLYPFEPSAP